MNKMTEVWVVTNGCYETIAVFSSKEVARRFCEENGFNRWEDAGDRSFSMWEDEYNALNVDPVPYEPTNVVSWR